ncbi:MAG: efflux RND transporter periplasmic adaptor subunit [Prevotella sp.]|uniref:Efflux RND transporter periplasmic adaptor subunit n=1 Tax=Hallella faecis TaxID=2841596 RepID=A0ABV1FPI8_9BACT|nr:MULTISPECIES: efflux RND transporter periplasmic adaptor subunit [Hallella]MBU0289477.1 efflux RND transporter periplasmic adaptor subunit [Hallella faecis]MCI7434515.1 efflux RND transporter periplasmic adaptor subunit [Prevotella sp.]MDD7045770.1 efflux RND transporter periplasmic adaptor subunit [Prevotella sp.]MDY5925490.1 efflux RND transporter periplasmic adaptor subunit [Hallella sp.]
MTKSKILLFAALAAMLVSCGGKKSSGKPNFGDNEYAVRTIGAQSAELQTTYPATIRGMQDVEIRPKVSGFITKLCVKEGQAVKAGQLLFVIDNVTYAAAVRQAKAAVNSAKAQLNTARLTYNNNEKLFKNNVIGSYELQSAKNNMQAAAAALAQAEASYVSAKENLSYCYVTSPASGVIGDLPYRVGALVSASSQQPLTTVSNISTMQVYFSMTEKELLDMTKTAGGLHTAIKDYPAVKLQLADGTIYDHPGRVATVSGVIDATTGSVSMRADFPNPQHLLKSGGSGSIVVPHVSSSAIVIPQYAVAQVQDKHFVYIVGKDNKVKYSAVTVDPQDDGKNFIITSGLKVGDRIVVNGISSLTDGAEIKPITEAQYQEKLKKTEKLGAAQGDLKELKKAFGK